MAGVTITELKRRVKRMQDRGMDIALERQNGQCKITNKAEDANLSSLGTRRQISDWLWAYERGWEDGEDHKFNEMRKEAGQDSQWRTE